MATKKTKNTTAEPAIKPVPAAKKATRKPAARKNAATIVAETEYAPTLVVEEAVSGNAPTPVLALPTYADIAHAAYLNYLSRVQNGIPGDAHGDWLDAVNRLAA